MRTVLHGSLCFFGFLVPPDPRVPGTAYCALQLLLLFVAFGLNETSNCKRLLHLLCESASLGSPGSQGSPGSTDGLLRFAYIAFI